MHPAIHSNRKAQEELCRQAGVTRLELFGSAARDDFDPARSDFDFLVEFDDDRSRPILDTYFTLKQSLERLLARPVDLVSLPAVENPYVRADIERSRTLVNAA
jgi:predicted nucleotidyltransferase